MAGRSVIAAISLAPSHWTAFDTTVVVLFQVLLLAIYIGVLLRRLSRNLTGRLAQLNQVLARVEDEWRFQHRQGTHVGTIEGLFKVLKMGLDEGGLSMDLHRSIYAAADEMFDAFRAETEQRDHEATSRFHVWKDDGDSNLVAMDRATHQRLHDGDDPHAPTRGGDDGSR